MLAQIYQHCIGAHLRRIEGHTRTIMQTPSLPTTPINLAHASFACTPATDRRNRKQQPPVHRKITAALYVIQMRHVIKRTPRFVISPDSRQLVISTAEAVRLQPRQDIHAVT